METFIIIASIVIFVAVGVLLPVALISQSKRTKNAIENSETDGEGEETEVLEDVDREVEEEPATEVASDENANN